MNNATDNELHYYPKSKPTIKNILLNSFKFLIQVFGELLEINYRMYQ
jgi:hypothetical protein